jgi:eukaryotic-like serine/threonine-protein kinase
MNDRWQQIKELYHAALEREEGQRAAYLHEVCAEDAALRQEVESLLAQGTGGDGFLESPAIEVAAKAMAKDSGQSLKGRQLASYKIVSLLGAGGMGEVYQAHDTKLGRDVALKVLPQEMARDPERLARFRREARSLAALNHPHIVTIFSVEEADGIHFLTMELVEGRSLDRLILEGDLPVARILDIAIAIAEALATAHDKGIVHRDLKPANVMLTGSCLPSGQTSP